MRDGDSGWRNAGFSSPTCTRFEGNRGHRVVAGSPDGWRNAGYDSPACERFARA